MATTTEKLLSHKKKRSGVLVPLLEDRLMRPLNIDDEVDVEFVEQLVKLQTERKQSRSLNGFFSPSSLSSCLRQVYLARHHQHLEIKRRIPTQIEPNFYFFTGNWLHIKWQFALHKIHRETKDAFKFQLLGVEVSVRSKHGDHGGTIDAIVAIESRYYIVDFKGVNVRSFRAAVDGDVSLAYKIQIADYCMLANVDRPLLLPEKIESGLIVFENKGGPDSKHPAALHEEEVLLKDFKPEIQYRLGKLREHESEESIPKPECHSIRQTQFTGCPFRDFCKKEVQERKVEIDSGDPSKYRLSVPSKGRSSRSRKRRPRS